MTNRTCNNCKFFNSEHEFCRATVDVSTWGASWTQTKASSPACTDYRNWKEAVLPWFLQSQ